MDDFPVFHLNPEHHYVLDQMDDLKSCMFLTGRAGTGKSSLIQLFRKLSHQNLVCLAPTGVAAMQIKGQTIHSFFKFPPSWINRSDYKILPKKMLEKIDLFFIDEVSMVRADLMDHIDQILRISSGVDAPFGGKPMLWCGDLFQLPPVLSSPQEKEFFQSVYKSPYFFSSKVFEQLGQFELIELSKVYRQSDPYFIRLLEKIRQNNLDQDDIDEINERCFHPVFTSDVLNIHLCASNLTANRINLDNLNKLESKAKIYQAKITGQVLSSQYPVEEQLILKEGAQVMFTRNDTLKRFVNGSLGTIQKLNDLYIEIESNSKIIRLEPMHWEIIKYNLAGPKKNELISEVVGTFIQFPLKLAWAITIHKSQGKTFDRVSIDFGPGAFEFGQAYVAFSRCKSIQGIQLSQKLSWRDVRTDERIIDFLRSYN